MAVSSLLKLGAKLRRGQVSQDARQMFLVGGREADAFYRQRFSHDKVVRSTHGVNCTGSCSWRVFVKDGLITGRRKRLTIRLPVRICLTMSRAAVLAVPRSPGTNILPPGFVIPMCVQCC